MTELVQIGRHKRSISYCAHCPKMCRHVCPVAEVEHRESVTPTWKMLHLSACLDGAEELDRSVASTWFRCLACGAEQVSCAHGIDVGLVMLDARELAREAGMVPRVLDLEADLAVTRDPGLTATLRSLLPDAPLEGEDVFVPGAYALRHDTGLVAHAWAVLAEILPVAPALWPGPQDLGLSLLWAGRRAELAARLAEVAEVAKGFRRLWVLDPEDLWLLAVRGVAMGVEIPAALRSPVEALDAWGAGLNSRVQGETVVFHDPCFLARRLHIKDTPRRVVGRAAADLVEPGWTREETWCCGGGGGYDLLEPDGSAAMARERMAQLSETGASVVATACPRCRAQLAAAAPPGIEVLDITELFVPA